MEKALILIIDKSPATRSMYADCFRYYGYAVAEAADGVEGVRLFNELQPDLIVTELSDEPEWIQAIQALRWSDAGRETALIACSTRIDRSWPFPPAGVDVDVALAKPTSPHALLQEAEQLLAWRVDSWTTASWQPSAVAAPSAPETD